MYRVLAFGDSNTFGWQTALEDGTPQPRLARRWPVMIGSGFDGVEVVEAGLPGRTAGMPARGLPDGIGPCLDGSAGKSPTRHSTVTLFARFRGWSTSVPRIVATW
jgi:hypothetical protein